MYMRQSESIINELVERAQNSDKPLCLSCVGEVLDTMISSFKGKPELSVTILRSLPRERIYLVSGPGWNIIVSEL